MSDHEGEMLQGVTDRVFQAQRALVSELKRIAVEHEITAYDVIAILEVLKHRTIQFIHEDDEGT